MAMLKNEQREIIIPEPDDSIHGRFKKIIDETDNDRKSEISNRIKFGDNLVKTALLFGFWGFWIFWLIVALAGI